jgi:hypothetical protein
VVKHHGGVEEPSPVRLLELAPVVALVQTGAGEHSSKRTHAGRDLGVSARGVDQREEVGDHIPCGSARPHLRSPITTMPDGSELLLCRVGRLQSTTDTDFRDTMSSSCWPMSEQRSIAW